MIVRGLQEYWPLLPNVRFIGPRCRSPLCRSPLCRSSLFRFWTHVPQPLFRVQVYPNPGAPAPGAPAPAPALCGRGPCPCLAVPSGRVRSTLLIGVHPPDKGPASLVQIGVQPPLSSRVRARSPGPGRPAVTPCLNRSSRVRPLFRLVAQARSPGPAQ